MTLQAVLERERKKARCPLRLSHPLKLKNICETAGIEHGTAASVEQRHHLCPTIILQNYFFPSGDAIHFFLASLDVDMEKPDTRKDRPLTDQVQLLSTL